MAWPERDLPEGHCDLREGLDGGPFEGRAQRAQEQQDLDEVHRAGPTAEGTGGRGVVPRARQPPLQREEAPGGGTDAFVHHRKVVAEEGEERVRVELEREYVGGRDHAETEVVLGDQRYEPDQRSGPRLSQDGAAAGHADAPPHDEVAALRGLALPGEHPAARERALPHVLGGHGQPPQLHRQARLRPRQASDGEQLVGRAQAQLSGHGLLGEGRVRGGRGAEGAGDRVHARPDLGGMERRQRAQRRAPAAIMR